MKSQFLTLFLFLCSASVLAQSIFIEGKILDQTSKEPIGYAHIGLPALGIGTTSSSNGTFKLSIPESKQNEWFTISFMGYKTFKKKVKELDASTVILLEKDEINLTEIIVMEETKVEDYIYRAVRNIPKNYPTYPTTSLGFYRESEADDSLNFKYMAEGILNIHKKGYDTGKDGLVSLVQGRRINLENPLDTNIYSGLGSGHFAAHRFDIVQNREAFLQKKNFPIYKYWMESITSYNDRPVYIIGFGPIEGSSRKKVGRMEGRVFIEKGTYAILRAEFEMTPKALKKMAGGNLYAGNWSTNKYIINYRLVGDKWYFSDALREGTMPRGSRYTNEILITDINLEKSKPIPYLDRLQRNSSFTLNTGGYDEDFWKDYNTSPLSGKLAESVQQVENAKKAQEAFDHEYLMELKRQRDSIREAQKLALEQADTTSLDIERLQQLQRLQQVFMPLEYRRFKFYFGVGTQLLSTQLDPVVVNYFSADDSPETILFLEETIDRRAADILSEWMLDIYLKKHFYATMGWYGSYLNGINKHWQVGMGTAFNISKQRPFFVKLHAGYSFGSFARDLGTVENQYGEFKVKKKKFDAEDIKVLYGSKVHSANLSSVLAIELDSDQELYLKGSVHLPFANRPTVWFKEKGQFFKKQKDLRVDHETLSVTRNGLPFKEVFFDQPIFSITAGLVFK